MGYRTIEVSWFPRSRSGWATFTAARLESARLWGDLVERHFRIRRLNWKWPSKARWQRWAKRKYPNLSAQSAQQVIGEFCEAVESARRLRAGDHPAARYPWKKTKYRSVPYTNQDAKLRDGVLRLPSGKAGALLVRIPNTVTLPGRLMEARLEYGRVLLVYQTPDTVRPAGPTIGVDLGVNTLIAATDGGTAILVSGREVKATIQWRNKKLASAARRQSAMTKGSSRWLRLQRRKRKMLRKADRRIRDLAHKATRQVANAFPNAHAYVGEPFNDAAEKVGRFSAQAISQAINRTVIELLDYKLSGALAIPEPYTSQTCPVCGGRRTCRRMYRCPCGVVAPRDVVGAVNILSLGVSGKIVQRAIPSRIMYRRPDRRSTAGHAARSSG
jgi:putative transposase